MKNYQDHVKSFLNLQHIEAEEASLKTWYEACSRAVISQLPKHWERPTVSEKRACYFSAEFLLGRLIHSNLYNLGLLEEADEILQKHGRSIADFEEIDDIAQGNGGLGRLAACFLDSAATSGVTLDGYGIRYQYGIFKQRFEGGYQHESADDWSAFGDPWSVRREEEAVLVHFRGQTVRAIPYDMPVIGFGGKTVNFLRLWKAEAVSGFDFERFNEGEYEQSFEAQNRASEICAVLYPNDNTRAGKMLRLKQQYFFSSASLQNIISRFVAECGTDFSRFHEHFTIQLNDTHPAISIPELLRILMSEYALFFDAAFDVVRKTFAFTNHTVMPEALEQWEIDLYCDVLPEVYPYVILIQNHLARKLCRLGITGGAQDPYQIIKDGRIHMAPLSVYGSYATNGVSELHTRLLQTKLFKHWQEIYPTRIHNKTNGITQRRWMGLCNPELSAFITNCIGDGWLTDLNQLERLKPFAEDQASLLAFRAVKQEKKMQLAAYIGRREGITLNTNAMLYSLCKRLHEYKRQFLDALAVLDIYFRIKDGEITDFVPSVFLYGGKAAPGYTRAKGIIKFINEIANLVNNDPDMQGLMQIIFVQDYNVSYAEKIIPATDVSVQISTAGTEASGTGNMKMSLNGAVTLGTRDGANIEIVARAGEENNYMFGADIAEITEAAKVYFPMDIYKASPRIRRVLDTLIDGTFDDGGLGVFRELYDSVLHGTNWHAPDHYFLLLDFEHYVETKLRVNRAYQNTMDFARKGLLNIASLGFFSSDNTIKLYAKETWGMGDTL